MKIRFRLHYHEHLSTLVFHFTLIIFGFPFYPFIQFCAFVLSSSFVRLCAFVLSSPFVLSYTFVQLYFRPVLYFYSILYFRFILSCPFPCLVFPSRPMLLSCPVLCFLPVFSYGASISGSTFKLPFQASFSSFPFELPLPEKLEVYWT